MLHNYNIVLHCIVAFNPHNDRACAYVYVYVSIRVCMYMHIYVHIYDTCIHNIVLLYVACVMLKPHNACVYV